MILLRKDKDREVCASMLYSRRHFPSAASLQVTAFLNPGCDCYAAKITSFPEGGPT